MQHEFKSDHLSGKRARGSDAELLKLRNREREAERGDEEGDNQDSDEGQQEEAGQGRCEDPMRVTAPVEEARALAAWLRRWKR